jgi:tight adherence protein C
VALRRDELRQKQREALAAKGKGSLRVAPKSFMKATVERFNLRNILESPEIRLKLVQAGLRGQAPIVTFMFFRLVMPVVLFFVAVFYLFLVKDFGLKPPLRFVVAVAGAGIGYFSPDIFVTNMIQKRQQSIQLAFPDALDLLLICVESGMSIEAAINKVAAEVGSQSVELAAELALTTAELSYLNDRRQALENLAKRTGLEGVKAVVTALIQAERYGTPLGTALRVMAQENRDIRMNAAEKKAGALPAQLTVPMIVFFLPCLFVVILGPAIIQVMHVFK